VERGEIYWCDLEPRRGHEQGEVRPVVIISADPYNESYSPLIAVVPLTRVAAKNPIHVALSPEDTGMDSPSTALIDHARFIDRSRLRPGASGRLGISAKTRFNRNMVRLVELLPSPDGSGPQTASIVTTAIGGATRSRP
jgi:mRNA interferase MazF